MKIVHNISLNVTEQTKRSFRRVGVELELGFTTFKIQEDDPRWTSVKVLVEEYDAVDSVRTLFSRSERARAQYLEIEPTWHCGYPMPDDDFGYLEGFDRGQYCSNCGIGLRQISPFRMKAPPKWGDRSILQLNWIFDEYFVKPEIWTTIFKPLGIKYLPVLLHRNGTEIESVVQLVIDQIVDLELKGAAYEKCASCGQKKYLPIARGFSPKPTPTHEVLFKSRQYFGSGASAYRLVIGSAKLYRLFDETNFKGITFSPCLI